jgi:hypothetical protein
VARDRVRQKAGSLDGVHYDGRSWWCLRCPDQRGQRRAFRNHESVPSSAPSHGELLGSPGLADAVSGTQRPYAYCREYFDRGAPWTFIVQNQTPHCCIINARALVLEWLDAVVIRRMQPATGRCGFITTAPSETENCPDPRPALVPPSCHSTVDTWRNVG